MKASNINDLRRKINRARENAGLAPVSWGPDVTHGDTIQASHMTEIRNQIRSLWLTKGIINQSSQFPGFGAGEPVAFKAIPALDVNDPRVWINKGQDFPTLQGVSTLAHNPADEGSYVGDDWIADIRKLQMAETKRIRVVRCVVGKSPGNSPSPDDITAYVNDFDKYRDPGQNLPGYRVFVVLNKETFDNGKTIDEPLGTVGSATYTNEYIEGYASTMTQLMSKFNDDASVSDFILWNEPNSLDINKDLKADRFAALLRRTWLAAKANARLGPRILADPATVRLYWGGIFYGGSVSGQDTGALKYIRDVYEAIEFQRSAADDDYGNGRIWPWHGINIHPHGKRDSTFVNGLIDEVDTKLRIPKSDTSETLIGEWGIKLEGAASANFPATESGDLKPTFLALRGGVPTVMIYFSHHLNEDDNDDLWGVRRWFNAGEPFAPCADTPSTDPPVVLRCGNITGRLGPQSATLYDALQEALGL